MGMRLRERCFSNGQTRLKARPLSGLVPEAEHSVGEAALFEKIQLDRYVFGQDWDAPAKYRWREEEMILVDESGSDCLGGERWATYSQVVR